MLPSETHLTIKYNFHLRGYSFYGNTHTDGKADGGTGILIRSRSNNKFAKNFIKATSINIQLNFGNPSRRILAADTCTSCERTDPIMFRPLSFLTEPLFM